MTSLSEAGEIVAFEEARLRDKGVFKRGPDPDAVAHHLAVAEDTVYRYRITEAAAQLGDKAPYTLLNLSVRMHNGMPQVCVNGDWYDYPKDERRHIVSKLHGCPVAGITSSWEIDRD